MWTRSVASQSRLWSSARLRLLDPRLPIGPRRSCHHRLRRELPLLRESPPLPRHLQRGPLLPRQLLLPPCRGLGLRNGLGLRHDGEAPAALPRHLLLALDPRRLRGTSRSLLASPLTRWEL